MLIAWASPSPNGAPITAYHVEYGSGQSVTQSFEVSPLETQYNMMDLRPSTSYRWGTSPLSVTNTSVALARTLLHYSVPTRHCVVNVDWCCLCTGIVWEERTLLAKECLVGMVVAVLSLHHPLPLCSHWPQPHTTLSRYPGARRQTEQSLTHCKWPAGGNSKSIYCVYTYTVHSMCPSIFLCVHACTSLLLFYKSLYLCMNIQFVLMFHCPMSGYMCTFNWDTYFVRHFIPIPCCPDLLIALSGYHRFHEVYTGTAVSHRLTRLQPDTEYVMKIAAMSESGQGVWSDDVTFMTTPTTPPAPTGKPLEIVVKYYVFTVFDFFRFGATPGIH